MILLALLGGGSAEKQTRRRIERIRASNAPTLTPQQMVSIRLSDNDSGIVLLDGLIKHLVPRPDLLRRRLAQAGPLTSLGKYVMISLAVGGVTFCLLLFFKVGSLLVDVPFGPFDATLAPHATLGLLAVRPRHPII